MQEIRYVIFSPSETNDDADGDPMFWNNEIGWCDLSSATVFTQPEMVWIVKSCAMPNPADSRFVQLPERSQYVD